MNLPYSWIAVLNLVILMDVNVDYEYGLLILVIEIIYLKISFNFL